MTESPTLVYARLDGLVMGYWVMTILAVFKVIGPFTRGWGGRERGNCHRDTECVVLDDGESYTCVCPGAWSGDGILGDGHTGCTQDKRFIHKRWVGEREGSTATHMQNMWLLMKKSPTLVWIVWRWVVVGIVIQYRLYSR